MAISTRIRPYILLLVLTGCATTTDPRQGGLFSYSPKAYEQRLQERRTTLSALDEKNQQEQQSLEDEVKAKRQILAEQKSQLTALDTQLAETQQRIATYQAQSQEQTAQKVRLEREMRQAEARLRALEKEASASPQDVEAKQAKIQQLRADIEKLSKVANEVLQSALR
jgi:chromosome segregation ATPase